MPPLNQAKKNTGYFIVLENLGIEDAHTEYLFKKEIK